MSCARISSTRGADVGSGRQYEITLLGTGEGSIRFAFAQLENERTQSSFCDELVEARQDISRLRREISELQTRLIVSTASTSISWRCLITRDFLTGRSLVLVIRPKATDVERRMRAHLTWQSNLDALPMRRSIRNGPMNLGSSSLLPTFVSMCHGKFTVNSTTKSPSLNKRAFALSFLPVFRFCRFISSAMESCTKWTTFCDTV